MHKLTIATRGSKLALWQAKHVKDRLEKQYPGLEVSLLTLKTTGDKILDVPLAKVGGKGLFVKEIEEALLDGRADLAVHSMKDVPVELPQGLVLGVVPRREDFTDTLLSVHFNGLSSLPRGAKVGTSSLRRKSQLSLLRPDLVIKDLRGNVDTRLRKLVQGEFDAIVMATAGLNRLNLSAPKQQIMGPPKFLPAVAQGALGIEYRKDRMDVAEKLAFMDHADSRTCVMAERGFLTGLEGGCQVPIAAHARLQEDTVVLTGFVADIEGRRVVRRETSGPARDAFDLGLALARETLASGGKEILDQVYGQNNP